MRAGELRVVTRNLPSAYYLGAAGPQGPEFDLASRFAAELGVRLFIYSVPNVADAMRELESHRAHIAAAGLTRGIRLPRQRELRSAVPAGARAPDLPPGRDASRARSSRPTRATSKSSAAARTRRRSSNCARAQSEPVVGRESRWRKPRSCCIGCRGASSTTRSPIPTSSRSGARFIRRFASHSICRGGKSLAWAVDTRDASLLKRVTAFYSSLSAEGRLASILDTYYGDTRSVRLHPVARLHRAHRDAAAAVSPLVSRSGGGGRRRLAIARGDRLPGVALGSDSRPRPPACAA